MHKEKNIEKKETLEKNTKIESKENNSVQEKTITLKEAEYNELLQYKERIKDYEEKILRLQADFDNMLKRMEREKQEFARFANQGIILDLLNILDDLERSINMAQEKHIDFPVFLKGIEIILAHLYELLKKYGVKPIESEGKIFDPYFHEALMQVERDDLEENTIIEEFQKGYLLNDKVLRTAKVKVSKQSSSKQFSKEVDKNG